MPPLTANPIELGREYCELAEWLIPQGYGPFKVMLDGSLAALNKFIFTTGLLTGVEWHNAYEHRWCYESWVEALLALSLFEGQGDPQGPWLKYKGIGPERHNPLMYERDERGLWKRRDWANVNVVKLWPKLKSPISEPL